MPSEPEKFSIDEIIDRLKQSSADEAQEQGELITRADGTQAVRVRKRKRRSQQPEKAVAGQQRRSRMIQVSAVLILLLAAALVFGSAIIYANSSSFREKIIRLIGDCSGAQVKLERLRINPARAVAGQVTLTWPEGNALRELAVRGASADIAPSSFFGNSLHGEEVSCSQGLLTVAVPKPGEPLRTGAALEGPSEVRFQRYAISKLQVRFGDPVLPLAWLEDSEASFQPNNAGGRPQLLLNRGVIHMLGWPKLRLDRSHIEFPVGELNIVGMRLLPENDNLGTIELTGAVSPYAIDQSSVLSVRLESFPLPEIAGTDMGRLVSGRISSVTVPTNTLSLQGAPDLTPVLTVTFQNPLASPVQIHHFPFITQLARAMEDNWFESPIFEEDAKGMLVRSGSSVTLEGLDFRNKDRMAVRGTLTVTKDRKLSGALRVGITPAMVASAPNRNLDLLAGPVEDGFRWFDLKIGGTSNAPTDDFLRLLEAAKSKTERTAPASRRPSDFDSLTTPE